MNKATRAAIAKQLPSLSRAELEARAAKIEANMVEVGRLRSQESNPSARGQLTRSLNSLSQIAGIYAARLAELDTL